MVNELSRPGATVLLVARLFDLKDRPSGIGGNRLADYLFSLSRRRAQQWLQERTMAYDSSKAKLHEKDHSHRHENDFRVTARRNKLLGLWAAELMNIRGAAAEAYAKDVITADLEEPGDEDVFRKILGDFARRSVPLSRENVSKKMDEFLVEARHQFEER